MKVALSRLHFPVTTLGPGRRLGLWFQGCSIQCPGCISVDTWAAGLQSVNLEHLLVAIEQYAMRADGLTVTGGEPFDQPDALAAVLKFWRSLTTKPTFVFTGYELNEIADWLELNPNLVDAVMTGPFRSDLAQTRAMRGSDNQELHVLSNRGREMLQFERPSAPSDKRLDLMVDDRGQVWMAGIPARGDIARLRRALTASGHEVTTSAERESYTA